MTVPGEPIDLDPGPLAELLADPVRWPVVQVVGSTGSTNADLAAAVRAGGARVGTVRLAWYQTSGRGRLDRRWEAPPGSMAAVSVLVDATAVAPDRLPWLSLVTGLGVVAGVGAATGLRPELKWPNDVLLDGRKLCGILAERVDGPEGARVVLGLGLNLTQRAEELPVPTATSLALAGARDVDGTAVVAACLRALGSVLDRWRTGDPTLVGDYRARCGTLGRDVVVHLPGGDRATGRAVDVDANGRVVVRVGGVDRAFAVGDVVHLRPRSG
ncbi:biotin--[acetyl-CoA-carboxylase] ligase [Auraticoccus monumenti]|uniref:biotin--[biotin carboxyl-carrier protein] ligase n=1 Tax=Auraticoccus monumenti TaxID=675864 RepID=A0A1G6XZZ0_9ACTN|nr:biotin--[acetyl-CoA-carboxylase] ligase [Auraticoccus monumenti]SDD83719.1 BirA family transcriptional regulator, biotin operon repressor / biotin-[acetyl-CoA-carboxylase] ligase [Auraticoccus monumenti]